jgi:hypothetical protein
MAQTTALTLTKNLSRQKTSNKIPTFLTMQVSMQLSFKSVDRLKLIYKLNMKANNSEGHYMENYTLKYLLDNLSHNRYTPIDAHVALGNLNNPVIFANYTLSQLAEKISEVGDFRNTQNIGRLSVDLYFSELEDSADIQDLAYHKISMTDEVKNEAARIIQHQVDSYYSK